MQSQPTPVVAKTFVRRLSGDHYLTLSIVLTFLCFFLGTWYSLFCTIPAIIFAISVSVVLTNDLNDVCSMECIAYMNTQSDCNKRV